MHEGVTYDVEVDTGTTESIGCARLLQLGVADLGLHAAARLVDLDP